MCQDQTEMLLDITGSDLFDQNIGMACTDAMIRCTHGLMITPTFCSKKSMPVIAMYM